MMIEIRETKWVVTSVVIVISLCGIVSSSVTIPLGPNHFEGAVNQAHAMHLIPEEATVDKTAPGVEAGEVHILPFERANLNTALAGTLPLDVIRNLESQVDAIGGALPPRPPRNSSPYHHPYEYVTSHSSPHATYAMQPHPPPHPHSRPPPPPRRRRFRPIRPSFRFH